MSNHAVHLACSMCRLNYFFSLYMFMLDAKVRLYKASLPYQDLYLVEVVNVEQSSISCAGRISHCLGPTPPFPCPYVRVSFAMAPEEDIPKGMQRLANVLKKQQPNL